MKSPICTVGHAVAPRICLFSIRVAYVLLAPSARWGGCARLKWIFSDLPTYLPPAKRGHCEPAVQGGYHFTIYMPPQLAQYSYLPTYLPKQFWGSRRAHPPHLGGHMQPCAAGSHGMHTSWAMPIVYARGATGVKLLLVWTFAEFVFAAVKFSISLGQNLG